MPDLQIDNNPSVMFSKTLSNSGEEYNGNFYTIKEINNSLKVIINQCVYITKIIDSFIANK